MIQTQAQKIVMIAQSVAVDDNAAYTTTSIDTLGYDYVDVYAAFGAMDIAMATLKLQESDADSAYADIPGGDYSVSPATLPSATSDNTIFAWHVNMTHRKRWLDLSATAGDGAVGTYMVAWAVLSRAKQTADTAAKRGVAQELFV